MSSKLRFATYWFTCICLPGLLPGTACRHEHHEEEVHEKFVVTTQRLAGAA